MSLEEVQAYKKRLEKEYSELLSDREGILKQIEIEEQELEKIKEIKKMSEPEINQEILALHNKIRDLQKIIAEKPRISPPESINENVDKDSLNAEIKQIIVYMDRLKAEYNELLSYREGILKQTKIEEKKLKKIKQHKIIVGSNISLRLEEATKELNEIKNQKKTFVESLDERESRLNELQTTLEGIEVTLNNKEKEINNTQETLSIFSEEINTERKNLNELINENKEKAEKLDKLTDKKNKEIKNQKEDRDKITQEWDEINDNKNKIEKQRKSLNFKNLNLNKKEEFLNKQFSSLEADKIKLADQRDMLNRAKQEIYGPSTKR